MTNRETLLTLADRVEAMDGPDRAVDAEIAFDLFAKPCGKKSDGGPRGYLWPEDSPSWNFGLRFTGTSFEQILKNRRGHEETLLIERDNGIVLMNDLRIKNYTASLDAAMTMMPEGWLVVSLSDLGLAGGCMCRLGNPGTSQDAMSDCGVRTLTLALTAACLRARSM